MSAPAIESVRFVVLGPPRVKERPRVTSRGTFTPTRTKQYERAVAAVARVWCGTWRTDGVYRVMLDFYGARALRGDTDNYAKAALDGLEGVAFANDRQVSEVVARKHITPREERTEVFIERIGDAPAPKKKRKRTARNPLAVALARRAKR